MRPLTVLIGILMGSAASITFGLGTVLIVLLVLAGRHPDLSQELKLPRVLASLVAFAILTGASCGSFVAQAKGRSWRPWAHVATVVCLAVVIFMYWPHRS